MIERRDTTNTQFKIDGLVKSYIMPFCGSADKNNFQTYQKSCFNVIHSDNFIIDNHEEHEEFFLSSIASCSSW